MFTKPTSLSDILAQGFDDVIDVRSPSEFAVDRVPGAINLPVLDDAERARVGTIYKQESPFLARKIGAALVFRNAASHVEDRLMDRDGAWRPLVYCWRGGQRSASFTWVLREIGWRAETLPGGYKTYRRMVKSALYDVPLQLRFVQLGGYTGTAKTAVLHRLRGHDVQVLDLEGLAAHRGSLLGALPDAQPSQKAFESALAAQLQRFDPDRPVVVEAESSKIGTISLPPMLWDAMKTAPWIEIRAPVDARATYLAAAYKDVLKDTEGLRTKLGYLRFHRGNALVDHWDNLIAANDRVALCRSLAKDHYDPAYKKALQTINPRILARLDTLSLDDRAIDMMVGRLASIIHKMSI